MLVRTITLSAIFFIFITTTLLWAQDTSNLDLRVIKPNSDISDKLLIDKLKVPSFDISKLPSELLDLEKPLTKETLKSEYLQLREKQLESLSPFALTALSPQMGISDYASQCAVALGAPMPDFDCVKDGIEIPITQNGQPASGTPDKCDNPALLEGDESCALGARLGHLTTNNPDVEIVFICRKYDHVTADLFQDIAVIHHNKRTGGTCWYQSATGSGLRMRKEVGSPIQGDDGRPQGRNDLPTDAQYVSWIDPEPISCHVCHQADPYIRTPYVNQVTELGVSVLPSHPSTPSDRSTKYWHYKLQNWNDEMQQVIVTDQNAPAQKCVSCHRIGSNGNTCQFIGQAAGESTGNQSVHDLKPTHAWMHSSISASFVRTVASADTTASLTQLKSCCSGGVPGVCDLRGLPGRADTQIRITNPVQFEFNKINVLPNTLNRLSGNLINADVDDKIRWDKRNTNGTLINLGITENDTILWWRPDCKPGTEIDIIANAVTKNDGQLQNRGNSQVSRTMTASCGAIGNTDIILEQVNEIYAFPVTNLSASLTQNKVLVKGVGENLIVGDNTADEDIRTLLSFQPAWPSEATGIASARLRFMFGPLSGHPLSDPLALKVTLYDYDAPIDTNDYINGTFLPGLVSIDSRLPTHRQPRNNPAARRTSINQDVTDLVTEAFMRRDELQNRIPLSFMLRGSPHADGIAKQLTIRNSVRANSEGLVDTGNLLRPILEIKYLE